MKGAKDEEKVISPLFPRLHINDAEKGGPKAPPRNKMALYEQLSIPTQRYTSGSSNTLPLPHKNAGSLVAATSSSYKTVPFSPVASHLAERLHSHTSPVAILNTLSKDGVGQQKIISERDLGHLSQTSHYRYFQPHSVSNFKNFAIKRLRDDDECKVPAFVQTVKNTLSSVDEQRRKDKEAFGGSTRICGHVDSTLDLLSKQHMSTGGNVRVPLSCGGNTQKLNSVTENEVEILGTRKVADDSSRLHQKYIMLQKTRVLEKDIRGDSENTLEKSNDCILVGESCLRPSLKTDDRSQRNKWALQLEEAEKDAETKEPRIMDSVSGVNISPDAVVEAIGQKQFWKARRAIVHQQRVFAVQVFELHRLIKVQRLFAESPDILLEKKAFIRSPSVEVLPEKKLCLENTRKEPIQTAKGNDSPKIPNLNSDNNKGLNALLSNYKPYSATESKSSSSPWCLQPPHGNQWLIPVMSPSEGLIYKPYTGPRPPTTGPALGNNAGPMGLTPGEDILKYGLLSPYCIPSFNPSVSSSAVGQAGQSAQARPKPKPKPKPNNQENHSKVEEPHFKIPCGASLNLSSGVNSCRMRSLMEFKESEVQASTASSPDIKLNRDALPLFPTAPTAPLADKSEKTQSSNNNTRVIKVIPRNGRLASESAARIFRAIQEERRQHG